MNDMERWINGGEKGRPDRESLLIQAMEKAINIREHRSSYRTSLGVGMIAPYRQRFDRHFLTVGLAVVLVTPPGKILTEHHVALGESVDRRLKESICRSYELTDGDLVVVGDFTEPTDPLLQAVQFNRDMDHASGEGGVEVIEVPEEARKVTRRLFHHLNHRFANPTIEAFVREALRQEV
jgi:hypothetical protein